MWEQRRVIDIEEGVRLNIINTSKFKSNLLVYNIIRPLNRDEATKNALLSMVLKKGTGKYKDNLSLQRKMEELYGLKIDLGLIVRGNKHIITCAIQFVEDTYIADKSYIGKVLKLAREIIFNPRLENDGFNEEILSQEKKNLKKRIKAKINNKRSYAIDKVITSMCKEDSFGISYLGYIDDIDNISSIELYSHYKNILMDSPIEIFYLGDSKHDIRELVWSKKFGRNKTITFNRERIRPASNRIIELKDKLNVNQGKLVLGYRTDITYEKKDYLPLLLALEIFGGGYNSKLFLRVREKESLAYYISSRIYKYKSIILVDAGIEFDKYEETVKIIAEELEDMKNGKITDKEMNIGKKSIVSNLESVEDSLFSILDYHLDNILTNNNLSYKDRIERLNNINLGEIVSASESIKLDTKYFMEGN